MTDQPPTVVNPQAVGDPNQTPIVRLWPGKPSPAELWRQAGGGTPDFSRDRYRELLIAHGHLTPLEPGEKPEPLPCGWPGPTRDDYDPEEAERA
jgi:hypothetical protein